MDPVDAEEVLMICGYDHLNSTNGLHVFFDRLGSTLRRIGIVGKNDIYRQIFS